MEQFCIRHTELPHASKLFTDYLYHFSRVAPFYAGNPYDPGSYDAVAERIRYPEGRRHALVAALREQNGDHKALEVLGRPGTVAVATGQQTGLFGGPAYSVYKALTAVKLARQLSSRGIPAVAVFWMATEDHDIAEVSHCWSFDAGQRPVFLQVPKEGASNRPVGRVPLVNPPLNELRSALSRLPYGDEVATIAEACYAPGRTFGQAFRDLMRRVLPGCLLFLDPLEPAIRSLAAPLMREALGDVDGLRQQLTERGRELEGAGYHSQVHVDATSTFFFLLDNGRRIPLHRQGNTFQAGDQTFSEAELAGRAEHLSPNALLRPVVQDHILPTIAYVGGPAEVAYFAQSQVIYRTLLGRMPLTVPRSAFTVLDSRAQKLSRRFGIAPADYFQGLETLEAKIAGQLIPAEVQEALVHTADSVTGHVDELRGRLDRFDPTLAAALDKSRAKIVHQLAKIERKVAREALRREDRAESDAAYLHNLVYPKKHLQERLYSILPLLARHGVDFIDRVYENVHLDCPDHIAFTA